MNTSTHSPPTNSLHHSPPVWANHDIAPIRSLASITRKRRTEWRDFFNRNKRPGTAPFCGPDIWLPWFFANPNHSPCLFEKRDTRGKLLALLPLCWNGHSLELPCQSECPYQELVATSTADGLSLLTGILLYCEHNRTRLTLGRVKKDSLLFELIRHSSVDKISKIVSHPLTADSSRRYRADSQKRAVGECAANSIPVVTRHYCHSQITDRLVNELSQAHRDSKEFDNIFKLHNGEHFMLLQARSSDSLSISIDRKEGEVTAYLIGYLEGNDFHISSLFEFPGSSPGLLDRMARHYYSKTPEEPLRICRPATSRHILFPRSVTNPITVAGYLVYSQARQLCRPRTRSHYARS